MPLSIYQFDQISNEQWIKHLRVADTRNFQNPSKEAHRRRASFRPEIANMVKRRHVHTESICECNQELCSIIAINPQIQIYSGLRRQYC